MISAELEVTRCDLEREIVTLTPGQQPRVTRRIYRITAEDLTGDVTVTWTSPEPVTAGTLVTISVQPRSA